MIENVSSLAEVMNHIHFEITEQAMIHHLDKFDSALNLLNKRGIIFEIDDFGTGYSSLSRLKSLPIKMIKIDRSFVGDIGNPENNAIIEAIIAMAKALKLEVIAEGVETIEQRDFLLKSGCTRGQGFLYYKPLTQAEVTLLLEQQK